MLSRLHGIIPIALACALATGCASTPSATIREHGDGSGRTSQDFRVITETQFQDLQKSMLFTADDVRYLQMSRSVLEPNVEELLDVWYGFVGSNPHLLYYFSHPVTKEPDMEYLSKVRVRFRDWVLTTAEANFDQDWLSVQLDIGLRHHRLKKNNTDGVDAAAHIPFRHLVALHYPITTTLKPFLSKGGHSQQDIDGMYEAWRKAVLMTTILWSQPYVAPDDF